MSENLGSCYFNSVAGENDCAMKQCNTDGDFQQRWLAVEVALKDAEAKGEIPVTYSTALSKILCVF